MSGKAKKSLLSFTTLLALVIVYLVLRNFWAETFQPTGRPLFPKLETDKITKIEISGEEKMTALEKKEGRFILSDGLNLPADESAIEAINNALSSITNDELVATKKEKWPIFGLDDKKGVRVKFYLGGKSEEFWVGKTGSDFQSTYFRINSDPKTYLTYKNVREPFLRKDFRDLTVVKLDPEKISQLTLTYQKNEIRLDKKNGQWEDQEGGKTIEADKVNPFLSSLTTLKGNNIFASNENPQIDFNTPFLTVKATTDGGQTVLTFGNRNKEGDYFVKTSLGPNIYTLPPYSLDSFPKTIDDLKK